jgi:hypothetical protein
MQQLLRGIRQRLAQPEVAALSARARSDADWFSAVALDLLLDTSEPPVAGASPKDIASAVSLAKAAAGMTTLDFFGNPQTVDFSQFKPRGHYLGIPRYFRALTWLGKVAAHLVSFDPEGHPVFYRRALDAALALRAAMGDDELKAWSELEATLDAFVGERDDLGPADLDRLVRDVGAAGPAEVAATPDSTLLSAILSGHYAQARVAGEIAPGDLEHPQKLPYSFSFTGARRVVDAETLSNVVFDRVTPPPGKPPRLMPDPLDVAFAVFASDEARGLLAPEIETYGYGAYLAQARRDVEAGGPAQWDRNTYTAWLAAIRELSFEPSVSKPPPFATSDAWRRRVLASQLASWAELRHDTILYAKPSYTAMMPVCSFPDVYVDPYPGFYERLARLADQGQVLLGRLSFVPGGAQVIHDRATSFYRSLGVAARTLGHIAVEQAAGQQPSRAELDYVNHAVAEDPPPPPRGCGGGRPRAVHGWYVDLFYGFDALEPSPTIADVHTQPTDAGGNPVGRVLHVGTGLPRLLVVNLDGRRVFTGLVSDYEESITEGFRRMNDDDWLRMILASPPRSVAWMRDITP